MIMTDLCGLVKFYFILKITHGEILLPLSSVDDSFKYAYTKKNFQKVWGYMEERIRISKRVSILFLLIHDPCAGGDHRSVIKTARLVC